MWLLDAVCSPAAPWQALPYSSTNGEPFPAAYVNHTVLSEATAAAPFICVSLPKCVLTAAAHLYHTVLREVTAAGCCAGWDHHRQCGRSWSSASMFSSSVMAALKWQGKYMDGQGGSATAPHHGSAYNA
eukprot:57196-Pelagomonas_calceolata.AAC.3